jgi:uncharacterized protein YaaN involved in tellurite resistance
VQFEEGIEHLNNEFEKFKSILRANNESSEKRIAGERSAMSLLWEEVRVAHDKIQELETELKEAAKWKQKYEKLRKAMQGAMEDGE